MIRTYYKTRFIQAVEFDGTPSSFVEILDFAGIKYSEGLLFVEDRKIATDEWTLEKGDYIVFDVEEQRFYPASDLRDYQEA